MQCNMHKVKTNIYSEYDVYRIYAVKINKNGCRY